MLHNTADQGKYSKSDSTDTLNANDIYEGDNTLSGALDDKLELKNTNKFNNNNNLTSNLLSPHNSVFQALANPDLNKGVDLSTIRSKILSNSDANNNLHNSLTDSGFLNNSNNLEFSVTSWQNVSSFVDSRSNSGDSAPFNGYINNSSNNNTLNKLPFSLNSNNGSNIISSGNNSPYMKNNETFNDSTPNRINSPNVASILSSSSGNDIDIEDINDPQSSEFVKFINNDNNHSQNIDDESDYNKKLKQQMTLIFSENPRELNTTLSLDSDTEDDDQDEQTVDSQTVISSFVMPKVSISNSMPNQNESIVDAVLRTRCWINVKVIGDNNHILLNRFKCYKKSLNNINFLSENSENIDLLILVLNNDNFMLPKMQKIPCIPIVLTKYQLSLAKKIPRGLKLCEPIKLESLDNDLMVLVDFLSNINNLKSWRKFLSCLPIGQKSTGIKDINSSLIELCVGGTSAYNDSIIFTSNLAKGKDRNGSGHGNGKLPKDTFSKFYLLAGVTVGVISISLLVLWKKLTAKDLLNTHSSSSKDITYDSLHVSNSLPKATSDETLISLDQYFLYKLKTLTINIESWGEIILSEGILLFHKAKLLLVELLNF